MCSKQINNCVLLHQRSKAATVVVGAEGWSDRPDPTVLMSCGFDPTLRPLPGSFSPGRHEDVDEEADDEAVLLWVNQSVVIALILNPHSSQIKNNLIGRSRKCKLTFVRPMRSAEVAAWVCEN